MNADVKTVRVLTSLLELIQSNRLVLGEHAGTAYVHQKIKEAKDHLADLMAQKTEGR